MEYTNESTDNVVEEVGGLDMSDKSVSYEGEMTINKTFTARKTLMQQTAIATCIEQMKPFRLSREKDTTGRMLN